MALLINEEVSPVDLTIHDDWCIKIPNGYRYSTYQNEEDGTLLTIHTSDDSESWRVKLSGIKVEGVNDLLSYGIRKKIELLILGSHLKGDKENEFVLRHESDLCIFCQLHDWFEKDGKLQSAVYWMQLITLKAMYEFEVRFDTLGTQDEYQEILNQIVNGICLVEDKKAPEYTRKFMALHKKLPVTEPQDSSIVEMYRQAVETDRGSANMMRLGLTVNDSVEYALRAFNKIDVTGYSMLEKSWDAAGVFRVNEKHFDPERDREMEIQHCLIREIDHMQTFRTFIWLVGEYCDQEDCSIGQLDEDTVLALGQLAGSRRSSYDEKHYSAICGFPDVFTAYLPNGENSLDYDKLPSEIKDNSSEEWRIADLNELRRELEELYPCMRIIMDYLRSNRKNMDMPLRGDHSDILYVWCSLTIAANRAFAVTPDAPMNYFYDDRMSYKQFLETGAMPEFDDNEDENGYDDFDDDDEDEDDSNWEKERKQFIAERSRQYENNCIIVKTIPTFSNKTFVASGVDNEDEIKSFLTEKGAFLRKSVSGKTDYLIVSPEYSGESKYKAVLEQAKKGHTVEVIFYDDFVKYMNDNEESSTGDAELDAAIDEFADKVAEAVMKEITKSASSDIKMEGNYLVFNDTFSLELPDEITFSPETDETYAFLSGFCKKNDDDDSIELMICHLDVKTPGALKALLENEVNTHEDECGYLMLFEDKDTEVAVFIQADVSMTQMDMDCNIILLIRVGEYGYRFQAQYGRSGFCLGSALTQDVQELCKIFDNVELKNSKKRIKAQIDNVKLGKIVDKMFGVDREAASALGEHCTEDTPAIVHDDWVITVPAGYMYSTDKELVDHRAVVLGLDDGTLDLSSPFDSTINFSVTTSNEEELSGEPLNAPNMENIVFQTIHPFGNILNTSCPTVRKDRDMVISYFERFETEDDYGRTVYQYMGTILTRRNIYSFQYFDKRAESSEEAETALKELLRSVKTKEEYEKTKAESTDDFAPIVELEKQRQSIAELGKQLQSLTLQVESGMSVESNPASSSSSSSVNVSASQNTAPAKKEGCYIATAVYGSYDAPEVMTLRRFRDEALKMSFLGRMFIRIYYTLSPPIAKRLKNAHKINRFVRNILDKWVDKFVYGKIEMQKKGSKIA